MFRFQKRSKQWFKHVWKGKWTFNCFNFWRSYLINVHGKKKRTWETGPDNRKVQIVKVRLYRGAHLCAPRYKSFSRKLIRFTIGICGFKMCLQKKVGVGTALIWSTYTNYNFTFMYMYLNSPPPNHLWPFSCSSVCESMSKRKVKNNFKRTAKNKMR